VALLDVVVQGDKRLLLGVVRASDNRDPPEGPVMEAKPGDLYPVGTLGLVATPRMASAMTRIQPVCISAWRSKYGKCPPVHRSFRRASVQRPSARLDSTTASMNFMPRAPSSTVGTVQASGSGVRPDQRAWICSATSQ